MKPRGKSLDDLIQEELELMLTEGFEKSPISNKPLHARLKKKGFITAGLSILSKPHRTEMIGKYFNKQLDKTCDEADIKDNFVAGRTVEGYKARNKKLKEENTKLKNRLRINTQVLVDIVHNIEMTSISVDNILPEFLVAQLDESIPEYDKEFTSKDYNW